MSVDFYREEIMDHFKHPNNRGRLQNPTVHVKETNPMCGDEIDLDLVINDGLIQQVGFEGQACSVSVVSSSFLTEYIKDKPISELKKLTKEDLLTMMDLNLSTSRIKCATLILEALYNAINKYEEANKH